MKSLLKKSTLAGVFSLLCTGSFATQMDNISSSPTTDRIIVKYKQDSTIGRSASMTQETVDKASRRAGHNLRHLRRMATGAQVMHLGSRKSQAEINLIINRLKQDPNIEYAEPDLMMHPMAVPNDPSYYDQWHYFEADGGLNLPGAWDITQGEGVVVAVIDTGYLAHTDLMDNLLPGYDMISDSDIAVDGDGRDSDASDPGDWYTDSYCGNPLYPEFDSSWHGTHVAGTIAAVTNNNMGIAGIAHKAKVLPVRVLGRCGGYTSDIADGIVWSAGGSVSGAPANETPAQVLNLSLGGFGLCGSTTQSAINTARSLGATVVVAAGNSGRNAFWFSPANCSGVITVSATNRSGGLAYYSNYGNVVDVAAPGGETSSVESDGVLSTLNSGARTPGSDSFAYYAGTSMAAPHVAGTAALIYSVKPNVTPDEVESILTSTARSFTGSCRRCGSGIVDAAAAVEAAIED